MSVVLGDARIDLEIEMRPFLQGMRHSEARAAGDLADDPFDTKRIGDYVGRRCRSSTIKDVAQELNLDWDTGKTLATPYMAAQLAKAGAPGPKAIGIDEIWIRRATATASW